MCALRRLHCKHCGSWTIKEVCITRWVTPNQIFITVTIHDVELPIKCVEADALRLGNIDV